MPNYRYGQPQAAADTPGVSGQARSGASNPNGVTGRAGTPYGSRVAMGNAPAPGMGGGTNYANTTPVSPAGGFAGKPTTEMNNSRLTQATTGTESGPGILEQWFNQRAQGIDPAYEYAMKRGGDLIDSRMAAGGSFNSGARAQQQSDLAANLGAQRMSQLDALAGGASGEHQGRLNAMFSQGLGLAGGQAGTMGQYDQASANANNSLMQALMMIMAGKAGVDQKANQGLFNNILGGAALF